MALAIFSRNTVDPLFVYDTTLGAFCLDQGLLKTNRINTFTFIAHVAVSPNGRYIAVGCQSGPSFVVDLQNDRQIVTNAAFPSSTYGVAFTPDSSQLAFACNESSGTYLGMRVFNTATWTEVSHGFAAIARGYCCAISPSGQHFVIGVNEVTSFRVISTSDWTTEVAVPDPNGYPANAIAFSPDGSKMAVVYNGNSRLAVYDTATWTLVSGTPTFASNTVSFCQFSMDGTHLVVVTSFSPYMKLFRVSDWADVTPDLASRAGSAFFSPDGDYLYRYETVVSNTQYALVRFDTTTWTRQVVTETFQTAFPDPTTGFRGFFPATGDTTYSVGTTAANPVLDEFSQPVVAKVRAYDRFSGTMLGETTTDAAGVYTLRPLLASSELDVVFLDPDGNNLNNDLIVRAVPA